MLRFFDNASFIGNRSSIPFCCHFEVNENEERLLMLFFNSAFIKVLTHLRCPLLKCFTIIFVCTTCFDYQAPCYDVERTKNSLYVELNLYTDAAGFIFLEMGEITINSFHLIC